MGQCWKAFVVTKLVSRPEESAPANASTRVMQHRTLWRAGERPAQMVAQSE